MPPTGDGYCNLNRIRADVGFDIDDLPEIPPIFRLIQSIGEIGDAEMFSVFNMGVGFCVVVAEKDAARSLEVLGAHGVDPRVIGRATAEHKKEVRLAQLGLIGGKERLRPERG
ncbi:MAG: AIR synthase-related protein [Planctomycetota bacterium]